MSKAPVLTDDDYVRLLEFRTAMRKFLKFSEAQSTSQGLTPTQHQLLLAIRGHKEDEGPTIREVAECLLIRHHSAVELINRAEEAGLVRRRSDRQDQRVVRLALTKAGATKLARITRANLAEIGRLTPEFQDVWKAIARLGVAPARRSRPG